jgi:hypothetical protein
VIAQTEMTNHRPSVLLCDSELQSIRALKVVLRGAGMNVSAMQTAEEALTRAALSVPDLAIIEMELADSSSSGPIRTYPGVGYLLEDDATRPSTERPTPEARSDRPHLLRAA